MVYEIQYLFLNEFHSHIDFCLDFVSKDGRVTGKWYELRAFYVLRPFSGSTFLMSFRATEYHQAEMLPKHMLILT